jgi:dTDP-4-dehydrorhamnose reductase
MRGGRCSAFMARACARLLITGGSGFLGWNLAQQAAESYDVAFTYAQHPMGIPHCQAYHLDLRDHQQIHALVTTLAPNVIIHTAALANADLCETHHSLAYDVNVAATEQIAQCAEELGRRLVYISTDLVFDGQRGNYGEHDRPRPLNYYAKSKLLGENAVKAVSSNYLIVRTALMYGQGNGMHGSFLDWMRQALHAARPLTLFTDQYRTPLYAYDAARALLEIIARPLRNETFHLGGGQRVSRYEFGEIFVKVFGYDRQLLRAVAMSDVPSQAARGADCSLNSQNIRQHLSFEPADIESGLRHLHARLSDAA